MLYPVPEGNGGGCYLTSEIPAIGASMQKNFTDWHEKKALIHEKDRQLYFYEQEIWWVTLGCNVGFEEDGKNSNYSRPALILRKFSKHLFLGVPLSSQTKSGRYYHSFFYKGGITSTALLSQVRALSPARLLRKDGIIRLDDYRVIQEKIADIILKKPCR
jgi:mRNA interferase MazF